MDSKHKKLKYIKLIKFGKTSQFFSHLRKSRNTSDLHERLVYSYLGFRSRLGEGASIRCIANNTTLSPRTVQKTLFSMGDLVTRQGSKWRAVDPDRAWLTPVNDGDHWYDTSAYVKLYLPARGAAVDYQSTKRRFGLNHAAIYSQIASLAERRNPVLTSETGLATLLNGLNRKTVASVLNDLQHLGLIDRHRVGDRMEVTLLELTDRHVELFQPRPTAEKLEVVPPKPPADPSNYELKGDGYDEWRLLCKGLFTQKYAEQAIEMSLQLLETIGDFESFLNETKHWHEQNKLSGKVAKGNLGAFLIKRYQGRVEEDRKQRVEQERQESMRRYFQSEEYQAKREQEEAAAAANPKHKLHMFGPESITERVKFSNHPTSNHCEAMRFINELQHHLYRALVNRGDVCPRSVRNEAGNLARKILRGVLSNEFFNRHYGNDTFASPRHLTECVNDCLETLKHPKFAWSSKPAKSSTPAA